MKAQTLLDIIHYAKELDDCTEDELLKICSMQGYLDCLLVQGLINDKEYCKYIEGLCR